MSILKKAVAEGRTALSEYEAKRVLAAYQIPVTQEYLALDQKDVIRSAKKIGYPLVIKGCGSEFAHKTEKGLIRTDIRSDEEAITAYNEIIEKMMGDKRAVIIQEMINGKRELVAGLVRDEQFGPSVMFGIGGIFAEIYNDVTFRIAPLSKRDALQMMHEIRGNEIFSKFRGMEPVDLEPLCDILIRIGQIGIENEMVKAIDINPIIISNGRGIAVDALIELEASNKNENVSNIRNSTDQLEAIFQPRSVAIVGLPRGMKAGKLFLMALMEQNFPGPIYPVHPEAEEIDGLKTYPSVSAIPGPVDLAIILVPHHSTLPIVKECAAKGVKGAVLFTAGYKETGTEKGRNLEEELTRVAKDSGMRLFGPNCMGIYAPKSGLSFFPGLSKAPGPVGFVSHSGSLANILGRIAPEKGIRFSKAVSLGNECDIKAADLIAYLGNDPETKVIGAYLESISDGPEFLRALEMASRKKPVILWKVGLNQEGFKAASSHTGALASDKQMWEAVVKQGGAISIKGFDLMTDALMGFSLFPDGIGERIAILSGPGGMAVAAAEACGDEGLKLASLSDETRDELSNFVPPTGTSLSNPVDVGLTASLEMDIYVKAARSLASDKNVDTIVVIGAGFDRATNEVYTNSMIEAQNDFGKPFMIVEIPGFDQDLAKTFCQAGLPFFATPERAMAVYAMVRRYQMQRNKSQPDD